MTILCFPSQSKQVVNHVLTSCFSELVTLWQLLDRAEIDNLNCERAKHLRGATLQFIQFLFDVTPDEAVKAIVEDWFERYYWTIPVEVTRTRFPRSHL
jgi:hypothetical protein